MLRGSRALRLINRLLLACHCCLAARVCTQPAEAASPLHRLPSSRPLLTRPSLQVDPPPGLMDLVSKRKLRRPYTPEQAAALLAQMEQEAACAAAEAEERRRRKEGQGEARGAQ